MLTEVFERGWEMVEARHVTHCTVADMTRKNGLEKRNRAS